jgi:hypothetical protein
VLVMRDRWRGIRVVGHVYRREGLGMSCRERGRRFAVAVVDVRLLKGMFLAILRRWLGLLLWLGWMWSWCTSGSSSSGLCLHGCVLVQAGSLGLGLGLGWRRVWEVAVPGAVDGWRKGGERCFSEGCQLLSVFTHFLLDQQTPQTMEPRVAHETEQHNRIVPPFLVVAERPASTAWAPASRYGAPVVGEVSAALGGHVQCHHPPQRTRHRSAGPLRPKQPLENKAKHCNPVLQAARHSPGVPGPGK